MLDLRSLQPRIILSGGTGARYVSTGHLVYATDAALKAIAFDPATGQVHGDPVLLPGIEVATAPDNGAANFAISSTGTLVFTPVGASGIVPGDLLTALSDVGVGRSERKKEPVAIQPGAFGLPARVAGWNSRRPGRDWRRQSGYLDPRSQAVEPDAVDQRAD